MIRSVFVAFAILSLGLLFAACGGDDDDGDSDGGSSDATPASTEAAASDTEQPSDASSSGGGSGSSDGELFQMSGTGVLAITVEGETYEYDVTCEAANSRTLGGDPQWDYSLESADPDVIVNGTYQLVNGEETFNSLSVITADLMVSANEFSDVSSGGTEWSGSFTSLGAGGTVEGTFETSCS